MVTYTALYVPYITHMQQMHAKPCLIVQDNKLASYFLNVVACFVLISYLGGQERLYCSDERLDVAYDNPSLFCQISGNHSYVAPYVYRCCICSSLDL